MAKIQGVIVEDFSDEVLPKLRYRKGDIIKAINNVPVKFCRVAKSVKSIQTGDKVKVTVDRNGTEKTFVVELINMQGSTEIIKDPMP